MRDSREKERSKNNREKNATVHKPSGEDIDSKPVIIH